MKRTGRRQWLASIGGAAGTGILLSTALGLTSGDESASGTAVASDDVAPTEDLMREHGIHRRIILVYREAAHRLRLQADVPMDAVAESAALVTRFIHGYHEKLEEKHVLPRLAAQGSMGPLIATLTQQHEAGRVLTGRITELSRGSAPDAEARARLRAALEAFVRMYEPHAQREDTELIPAYRALLTATELQHLAQRFDEEEHLALGNDGFAGAVVTVRQIETAFGLNDLASFTPQLA